MFRSLDCVCLHTTDLNSSLTFYAEMGLRQRWRLDRQTDDGRPWTVVGLAFPETGSSELVLSTHPDRIAIEVEIRVDEVDAVFRELSKRNGVEWLAEPFAVEEGHVAVMRAPDGNVFVLIGA